jgi:O-antigen/teichoic acid export membrane protein
VLVSLLSVPLTIGYLGAERYGAWITIGSLLAWLQLVDFGIANGLTNAVTTAVGQDREDLAQTYISSSLTLLIVISAITAVIGLIVGPHIDWVRIFGLTSQLARAEIGPALGLAFAIFVLQLPLSVVGRVYLAFQEGDVANYWSAAGNVLSLLALIAVTQTEGGLPLLVLAVSGTGLVVGLISAIWLFGTRRRSVAPRLSATNLTAMREVGRTGGLFFLLQILALVVFQGDNLIISYFLGAEAVTPYAVTYRLFGYASIIPTLMFTYTWAAYSEAFARGDNAWVRKAYHRSLWWGTASTALFVVPMIFVAEPFIRLWAGDAAVPSRDLIYWMAAWSVIHSFSSAVASLLAAASHLKAQCVYSFIATIINLVLSVFLVQRWGASGVIAATVISYVVAICIPAYLDAEKLLKSPKRAAASLKRSAKPE